MEGKNCRNSELSAHNSIMKMTVTVTNIKDTIVLIFIMLLYIALIFKHTFEA